MPIKTSFSTEPFVKHAKQSHPTVYNAIALTEAHASQPVANNTTNPAILVTLVIRRFAKLTHVTLIITTMELHALPAQQSLQIAIHALQLIAQHAYPPTSLKELFVQNVIPL